MREAAAPGGMGIGTGDTVAPSARPSLGNYIFDGRQTQTWVSCCSDCFAAAALGVLVVDQLLELGSRPAFASQTGARGPWRHRACALLRGNAGRRDGRLEIEHPCRRKDLYRAYALAALMAPAAAAADCRLHRAKGPATMLISMRWHRRYRREGSTIPSTLWATVPRTRTSSAPGIASLI